MFFYFSSILMVLVAVGAMIFALVQLQPANRLPSRLPWRTAVAGLALIGMGPLMSLASAIPGVRWVIWHIPFRFFFGGFSLEPGVGLLLFIIGFLRLGYSARRVAKRHRELVTLLGNLPRQ